MFLKNAYVRVPLVRHSLRHAFSNRIAGIALVDYWPDILHR
jgi:hypothetical protein